MKEGSLKSEGGDFWLSFKILRWISEPISKNIRSSVGHEILRLVISKRRDYWAKNYMISTFWACTSLPYMTAEKAPETPETMFVSCNNSTMSKNVRCLLMKQIFWILGQRKIVATSRWNRAFEMVIIRSKYVHCEPTVKNVAANILILFECENFETLRALIKCFDVKSAIRAVVNHSVHFLLKLSLIVIAWTNDSDEFHLKFYSFLIIEKDFLLSLIYFSHLNFFPQKHGAYQQTFTMFS